MDRATTDFEETEFTYNSRLKRVREMTEADDNERCVKRARIASPEPAGGAGGLLVELVWDLPAGEYWWSHDN
jgi:hypothetical protein